MGKASTNPSVSSEIFQPSTNAIIRSAGLNTPARALTTESTRDCQDFVVSRQKVSRCQRLSGNARGRESEWLRRRGQTFSLPDHAVLSGGKAPVARGPLDDWNRHCVVARQCWKLVAVVRSRPGPLAGPDGEDVTPHRRNDAPPKLTASPRKVALRLVRRTSRQIHQRRRVVAATAFASEGRLGLDNRAQRRHGGFLVRDALDELSPRSTQRREPGDQCDEKKEEAQPPH